MTQWSEEGIPDLSPSEFFSAMRRVERGSIIYAELDLLPDSVRGRFKAELETSGANRMTTALKHAGASCVVFVPTGISGGKETPKNWIKISEADEETILVRRASVRGGNPSSAIASHVRKQISLGLWGVGKLESLIALDKSIRIGRVDREVDSFGDQVDQVEELSNEYTMRLEALTGVAANDLASAVKSKIYLGRWSETIVSALIEHALFVTTEFEGLTPSDFDFLMTTLLEGKTTVEQVSETEWVSGGESFDSGRPKQGEGELEGNDRHLTGKSRVVEKSVSLLPAYEEQRDRVLTLIDVSWQEGGHLGFVPAFKNQIAKAFLRRHRSIFVGIQLTKETVAKALFFDAPLHIASRLAVHYANHVEKLPKTSQRDFISDWMDRSARHFIEERAPSVAALSATEVPDPLKLLLVAIGTTISQLNERNLLRIYAERVGIFFEQLLMNPETKPYVDYALRLLMAQGQNIEGKHELILMFVRVLRRHPEFNTLLWLKRLLAEGDDNAKRSSLDFLARAIETGSDEAEGERAKILRELQLWIPDDLESSGLNNQTAALLAPRMALHRTFARTADREHGKVALLVPLFDLNRTDGLSPDFEIVAVLLTKPVRGTWVGIDLNVAQELVDARWDLDHEDPRDARYRVLTSPFPILCALDEQIASPAWTDLDARLLALIIMLIEAVALMIGSPDDCDLRRKDVVRRGIELIGGRLDEDSASRGFRVAYRIGKSLKKFRSTAAQRRSKCARWLGDTLYQLMSNPVEVRRVGGV